MFLILVFWILDKFLKCFISNCLCLGFNLVILFNFEEKEFLECNWWWKVIVKWCILFWIWWSKKNFFELCGSFIIFKGFLKSNLCVWCLLFFCKFVIGMVKFNWFLIILCVIFICFWLLLIIIKFGGVKLFFKILL